MNKEEFKKWRDEQVVVRCTIGPLQHDGFHRGANATYEKMQEEIGRLSVAEVRQSLRVVELSTQLAQAREGLEQSKQICKELRTLLCDSDFDYPDISQYTDDIFELGQGSILEQIKDES